ncbi:hypothetical protein [Niallia circulans]
MKNLAKWIMAITCIIRLEIMNYFLKRIRTIQLSATIIGSDEGENLKQ